MGLTTTQILLIAGITFLVLVIIISVVEMNKKKKRESVYVQIFNNAYQTNSVCDSLEQVKNAYTPKSTEYATVEKAVNYLQHSCLKDYQTAFAIVEDVFTGKAVESLHDTVIDKEKQKLLLLLEKKEGE